MMKKKLIVKQEEISDCGVCSLLSIIRYYQGNISLEELRISSLTSSEGVTALNLIHCAIEHGFDAVGKRLDKIPIDNLPCIAHIRINNSLSHFLVVYSVKKDKVVVMDPASKYKEIDLNTFYEISTNNYILLKPKGKIEYQLNPQTLTKNFSKLILKTKNKVAKIVSLNVIYLICTVLYSFYISFIQNNYSFAFILLFFILLLLSNTMMYLINNNINKLNNGISLSLAKDFFKHIFSLPLNYIHIKESSEIIKRVLDLNAIKDTTISFIITLITNLLVLFVTSIIIFIMRSELGFFILLSIIGYLIITILYKNIHNQMDRVIECNTNYNNSLIDYISGINSIKHSISEDYYKNKLLDDYKININENYKHDKRVMKSNFLKQSYVLSIEFFLNVYIIYLINNNVLSMSYLFVINLLFQLVINSIMNIGNYIPSLLYQRKIIIKVNEFYNIKEEDNDNQIINNDNIVIKDLSFSYNNCNNIINNLNIRINKGDKLIIKGESGCGKSTLCKILNKEYINYQGNIYLGTIDYKNLSVKSIRNLISYSSQNEHIFHGTIKDNILMGHEIDDKKLNEIIQIAHIDRITSKKVYGLDSYLYGGGSELSGGERQLIFLARLLVLDKNIMILDETLSEVNDKIENQIIKDLFNKYKNKTIIYISHKNKKEYFHKTLYV